ncbi:MAG: DUF349 domain-containing protein, partial [Prolixibacteraceae bacterium]|nr:DUF349 domain-containing protein [Prolixibacteraceae bacterium]
MEPKDLKNSDELKSTPETENNNSDINNTEGEENLNENVAEEHENEGQPEATDDTTDSLKDNEILQSDNKKKQPRVSAQKVSIPEESSKSNAESAHYGLTDYSKFSMIELINTLRNLLNEAGEKDIKRDVESIKAHFYKKLKEDVELQKQKFIEEGGKEEDFESEENPYENDLKELLKEYRQVRIEYSKKLEQDKEINLQVKYEVIEEIKSLIHKEESINKTFQEFRELQKRWREIGLVPQSKVKDLWDTYHFHVENFY